MNIVDPIVLTLLSLFAVRGYFKGLFRESLSLGGLVVGILAAVRYDESLAALGANYWKVSPFILKAASFVTIFFVVYFLFSLVGWLLHQSEKLLFLQTVNRLGGIVLGLGKGAAILAVIIFLLVSSSWLPAGTRQKLDESYLAPPLSLLARNMIRIGKTKLFATEDSRAYNARERILG